MTLAAGHLTGSICLTSMADMATIITVRDFVRNFARLRRTAANGGEVLIRDRDGRTYVFRAEDQGASLGDQLEDLRGRFRTGVKRKSLEGFGRNRR